MKILRIVNKIKNYNYDEIRTILGEALLKENITPFNKRNHAIIVITAVNVLISHFSNLPDSKLIRGNRKPSKNLIYNLINEIYKDIENFAILDYAPTYPKSTEEFKKQVKIGLQKIRLNSNTALDFFIKGWSDIIISHLTLKNIPTWAERKMNEAEIELNKIFSKEYGINTEYFEALKHAILEIEKEDRKNWINPRVPRQVDDEVIEQFQQFVWDEERLLKSTIEEFFKYPQFFIKSDSLFKVMSLPSFSFILDSYNFQKWLGINKIHGNLNGDASELVIQKLFTEYSIELTDKGVGLRQNKSEKHLDCCVIEKEIKNYSETKDLFKELGESTKNKCEIDFLAKYNDILLIGEIKMTNSYVKANEYYYEGDKDKKPERERLIAFHKWFSENIDNIDKILNLPDLKGIKKCIPVFITNQTGDLLKDNDGILKIIPLDIMFLNHFKKLISEFIKNN